MGLPALDNLVRAGQLKAEPRNDTECRRMLALARTRLADALLAKASLEGRFTSGYNAAHAAALAPRHQYAGGLILREFASGCGENKGRRRCNLFFPPGEMRRLNWPALTSPHPCREFAPLTLASRQCPPLAAPARERHLLSPPSEFRLSLKI